jgi:hypothetical protein
LLAGAITEFPFSGRSALPGDLTVGSDGNLWFPNSSNETDQGGSFDIGRITRTGTATEFPHPSQSSLGPANALTVGSDGNL